MAGFIFSMHSVLCLKKQHITQIRHEMALRLKDLRRQELVLEELLFERDCVLAGFSVNNLDSMSLQTHYAYRNRVRECIQNGRKTVVVAGKHVETVRARLLAMTKEKEILVKLQEREYEEYLCDQQAEEQKTVDEMVSYMYNKKNRAMALGGDRN